MSFLAEASSSVTLVWKVTLLLFFTPSPLWPLSLSIWFQPFSCCARLFCACFRRSVAERRPIVAISASSSACSAISSKSKLSTSSQSLLTPRRLLGPSAVSYHRHSTLSQLQFWCPSAWWQLHTNSSSNGIMKRCGWQPKTDHILDNFSYVDQEHRFCKERGKSSDVLHFKWIYTPKIQNERWINILFELCYG